MRSTSTAIGLDRLLDALQPWAVLEIEHLAPRAADPEPARQHEHQGKQEYDAAHVDGRDLLRAQEGIDTGRRRRRQRERARHVALGLEVPDLLVRRLELDARLRELVLRVGHLLVERRVIHVRAEAPALLAQLVLSHLEVAGAELEVARLRAQVADPGAEGLGLGRAGDHWSLEHARFLPSMRSSVGAYAAGRQKDSAMAPLGQSRWRVS